MDGWIGSCPLSGSLCWLLLLACLSRSATVSCACEVVCMHSLPCYLWFFEMFRVFFFSGSCLLANLLTANANNCLIFCLPCCTMHVSESLHLSLGNRTEEDHGSQCKKQRCAISWPGDRR
uniref:(northern house mosquito) hypothetical protein n=1 Tax=Culex pipiens TaxID=7175 RepID=A0A8D8JX41_CULPI